MDVFGLGSGLDATDVIDEALSRCGAMIVLIGPNWLAVADDRGRRRLDNPDDHVRLEIEMALRRNIRVIPVLVDGASVPQSAELPPSLAPLARRNGLQIPHAGFTADVPRLVDALRRVRPSR